MVSKLFVLCSVVLGVSQAEPISYKKRFEDLVRIIDMQDGVPGNVEDQIREMKRNTASLDGNRRMSDKSNVSDELRDLRTILDNQRRRDGRGVKVFLGNLSERTEKVDIEDFFRNAGRINKIWIARQPPGFGFVVFDDPRDAADAAADFDGRELLGRKIRVELARRRAFDSYNGMKDGRRRAFDSYNGMKDGRRMEKKTQGPDWTQFIPGWGTQNAPDWAKYIPTDALPPKATTSGPATDAPRAPSAK